MKKLLTILLVLMMVTATACSSTPDNSVSNSQGDNSTSENVTPDNSDENQGGNETGSGGNIVKPIMGGGDFNAGNDY